MSAEQLSVQVVEPAGTAAGALLLLHGLGASGCDFEPLLPQLPLDRLGLRAVLPTAPLISVTVNGGMRMPGWYDIADDSLTRDEDEAGIRRSAEQVGDLIAAEGRRGLEPERVALLGFSQGGAIALHTALRSPFRLAGVAALSTYLLLEGKLDAEKSAAAAGIPFFLAHGGSDPIVPFARAEAARDRLRKSGFRVEWRRYDMEHAICQPEIADLGVWLEEVFGKGGK
ncbi:MAG: hypothetical protein A2X36_08125 [Elusimicrobia bacterium GWA2_69_24]|nr:MAG: hypothetical protein A2X36_08125 [Elusimicrobia bacterium GWA2_69_24]HBL16912.1 carboxylesterase [Elusimicrobiota bacterium]